MKSNGAGHALAKAGSNKLDVSALMNEARFLVFGGTGFLGKVFWVLLLHRYPNLGKIFLLVRSSKTKTSEQRFWQDIATSEALKPLREMHGDGFEAFLRDKVVPVDGEMGSPLCGLAPNVLKDLKGTLDALINVAGVVDFNPPLDEALDANAFGSQNLVAAAHALGDVPLLHTSTCYVAGRRKGPILETDPREYPFPRADELGNDAWDPNREIKECLDIIAQHKHRLNDAFRKSDFEEQAKKNLIKRGEPTEGEALESELSRVKRAFVSEKLIEAGIDRATHWGWPNIYTYTKSIGEQVIAHSGLPFTIVRPACCESTQAFPFPGWNEGISTSAPIIFLAMKGQLTIPAQHIALDFIPTDYVCAGMVMALAELLEGTQKPVYQLGASDVNPCTAWRLLELIGLYKRKHYQRKGSGNPLVNILQAHVEPSGVAAKTFEQWGPLGLARSARGASKMLRRGAAAAPFLKGIANSLDAVATREEKINAIIGCFAPFTTEENGPFSCENTREAYARLEPADQAKLAWKPETIDYADWMNNIHLPAMEKWILPEMDKKLVRPLKALRAHETLVSLLDQMAERHDLALSLQRLENDGFTRVTYRDVRDRAHAVAAQLAMAGVKKGDLVVLSAKNHPDWAIAYFGILRAGATAVPIDPALDSAAFVNVVRESKAHVAIWDASVEAKPGAAARKAIPTLTAFDLHAVTEANASLAPPDVVVEASDIASLIYTSGTTGTPKGVKLTHANFASLIASLAPIFPLQTGDRVLSVLPLHHTFEFTCGLLLPFSRGARIAYLDELNADRLSLGLKKGRVTAMVGVPAVWQLMERRIMSQVHAKGPAFEAVFNWATEMNRLLGKTIGLDAGRVIFGPVHAALGGHVKYLISGGAALPPETQELFAGLGLHLTEGYGLTEAAPVLTVSKPSPRLKTGTVGKPVPGVEIKIDAPDDHGVGEVLARGPNVMAGYTDDEATKRVIDAEGWLRTGDLGKIDRKGVLSLVGRSKDVIITATGENIYPDDLERRLGSIENIAEIAIVGVEGKSGGERIACLAVPETDDSVERAARIDRANKSLRAAITKLPFAMQPAIIHMYDAPLPRTATRKVKRPEVRAILNRMMAASRRPEDATETVSSARIAIAGVKGITTHDLHATTSLQGDLGFDSLMLTELLEVLEGEVGTIDPDALQNCRTVAEVEALVETRRHAHHPTSSRTKMIEGKDDNVPLILPTEMQNAGRKFIGKLQDAFYGEMLKPRVFGSAFVPHNRNTIVISNHASHLDMGLIRHALGAYGEEIVSLAAQDYFFEGGVRRFFFENMTNLKAIDRNSGLRQTLRQASEEIERGQTVLIFPEGTRSATGEIQEFKPLIGHLALAHGVDILPIHLGGTHASMPKGRFIPTKRELTVRIGLPLKVADMKRLTQGMTPADAAREVTRLSREAVLALRDGALLDLSRITKDAPARAEREHPLVTLFAELEGKFRPDAVDKPVSWYFTLGNEQHAKWTVKVDTIRCDVRAGKPESGTADCVLKTSAEMFTRIVRESYVPGPADFLSGAIKSNDVGLLMTFQKVFQLDS